MPLIQLSYCSKIAMNASTLADDLTVLLDRATTRNRVDGITGCLAYCSDWFIQVIEGERDAVDATFERITKDNRHRDIQMLMRRDIRGRSFPDWNMMGANLLELPPQFLQLHGIGPGFDPSKVLGAQLLMVLMAIADRMRMQR